MKACLRPATLLLALVLVLVLVLGGCAQPGHAPAQLSDTGLSIPAAWAEAGSPADPVIAPDWWVGFHSSELSGLVDAALRGNPDIDIAAQRIIQAQAQVEIAGSSLFPTLNLGLDTARRESHPSGGPWSGSSSSGAALSASYEFDFWGRNAAAVQSARATLRATRFDAQTLRLTLAGGVANGYFQLLSVRARLAVLQQNLVIARRVLKLVDARARYGAVSSLDLARQRAAELTLRASLAPLALQEHQTLYALAILTGVPPEGFSVAGSGLQALAVPTTGPGLPAQLLLRRPDLASAEAQLAAANANVTQARAALLPSISLTGSAGLSSAVLVNLLNAPTASLALGAALSQPLFDAGRLRAQSSVAASREREALENYRKLVLGALAEVDTALAASGRMAEQEDLQEQVTVQARTLLRLSEIRYREGLDDPLALLDAQRTLFQAEDQLSQLRLARLQAAISLFKALGGGWRLPEASS